ncbi:hypothetical protein D1AOALGA4SA_5188 [Olavius algarvensis Delta 1 endosymbiont]|nr:hypothetical protein D1AOALGA4SA_5188 [Olavius algarvensis Delta 1 endosymbiont]
MLSMKTMNCSQTRLKLSGIKFRNYNQKKGYSVTGSVTLI